MNAVSERKEQEMMALLFFRNIPYNCSNRELRDWIESREIPVISVRIVHDLVAGVSPAFAYAALKNPTQLDEALTLLNGKKLRNQIVEVRQAQIRSAAECMQLIA
jgi:RNA recognition motif-containing protein